ncbi:hypothetical protein [Nocardioides marinquilinus]
MTFPRSLALMVIGALAASLAAIVPAHAVPGWRTNLVWQDAQAQVCAVVRGDGSAVVRVRMDNRRGTRWVAAGIASVRPDGRPDRTLAISPYVRGGRLSASAEYTKLRAGSRFYVDIHRRVDEGAGIVRTSAKPFVVRNQARC